MENLKNEIKIEKGEKVIRAESIKSGKVSIKENVIKISFIDESTPTYLEYEKIYETAEEAATFFNNIDTELISYDNFLDITTNDDLTELITLKDIPKDETEIKIVEPVEKTESTPTYYGYEKIYETAEEAATRYNRIGAYLSSSDLYYLIRGDEILDKIDEITIGEGEKVFNSPGIKNGKVSINENIIRISFIDTGDGEEAEKVEITIEEGEKVINSPEFIDPGKTTIKRNVIEISFKDVYRAGYESLYRRTFETAEEAATFFNNIATELIEGDIGVILESFELIY